MSAARPMLLVAGALLAGACRSDPGHAPTARIVIDPKYIPQGDDYATLVTLDGSGTTADFSAAAAPTASLVFAWTLDDGSARIASGSLSTPSLNVRLAGARATTVHLTVSASPGGSSTVTDEVGITIPADR